MERSLTICDFLGVDSVVASMESFSKKQLLQDLSRRAAELMGLEEHHIFDILWEREKLGTTGVGQGIAIPHGRVEKLPKVRGFFAKLTQPVAFDSIDERPVDLVFLLLSPEAAGADHLHALATVSRILRNPAVCENLRKARDAKAICEILSSADSAKAA